MGMAAGVTGGTVGGGDISVVRPLAGASPAAGDSVAAGSGFALGFSAGLWAPLASPPAPPLLLLASPSSLVDGGGAVGALSRGSETSSFKFGSITITTLSSFVCEFPLSCGGGAVSELTEVSISSSPLLSAIFLPL